MAQMWAGHCSLLMGATAHLKDEAVSHRLRQAAKLYHWHFVAPLSCSGWIPVNVPF